MPSRPDPPLLPAVMAPPAIPAYQHGQHHHHHHHRVLVPVLAGTLTVTVLGTLFLIIFIYRKLSYNRTAPFDNQNGVVGVSNQHQRFSYSLLRRATGSFSASNLLGHGGFGSVYKATLPSGQSLAVKLMDSNGSIQGEREFHNELSLALNLYSPHIISLLGYSIDGRGRKLLLVYELMPNRSLQEALFDRKCTELMDWKKRFNIILDIARGLEYLHHSCNPPVIHGDIKPSNVLVDSQFNAKIGDFGLARLKTEDLVVEEEEEMEESAVEEKKKKKREKEKKREEGVVMEVGEDNGSILEETESVSVSVLTGGFDQEAFSGLDHSPESCVIRISDPDASPETTASPAPPALDKVGVASESGFDKFSVESGRRKGGSGRDWWWKQDNNGGGGSESGRVKDYVMEWIGNEINKERPKSEWAASPSSAENLGSSSKPESESKKKKKKRKKRLEWWSSLDEERVARKKKEKNRKPREWWKEEFCEELKKKKKKKNRESNSSIGGESWWQKDEDELQERKKRKSKSSRGSIDWWLDGISGDLRSGRRNSQDWGLISEIPKSGGVSSTPSMRGTVCYVAPEYGGGGQLSERCDVYSYGVLILVLVSGRRPLQVTASPMSEFERANLTSWARQLARNDRLLDLVDPSLHSLDKEEALLCLTIALLCLQRTPSKRPSMKEIVGMLSGEAEPPHLPFEFSPSPPSNFPFKSRKKAR